MAKYLQWPTPPKKDTTITVQFHLWPNQIDKKKNRDLLFSARMASSNPAQIVQDFGLIQAHSRSGKQLWNELKGPSHLFLLVIDLLTLS